MSKAPRLIQSIERSASILEVIAQEGGSARLQQIAHLTGLGKTTVHNILRTLDHLGYVQRRPGDMRYHLGGRILNIARMAGDDNALRNRLRPALLAIAKESGGTVYLGVPSGDEASYLDIITPDQPPDVPRDILRRETLEGSAIGLVFLAFVPGLAKRVLARLDATEDEALFARIETVQAKGYALDIGAYRQGQNGVAIPCRENGEVRAGIAVAGPAELFPPARLIRLSWMMTRHAELAAVQHC